MCLTHMHRGDFFKGDLLLTSSSPLKSKKCMPYYKGTISLSNPRIRKEPESSAFKNSKKPGLTFLLKNKIKSGYTHTHTHTHTHNLGSINIRSDQISRSVVSDSLRPHESQHARPPCPSPTPGVHQDSRPSSQ